MSPPPKRTPEGDAQFFVALENAHPVAAACRASAYAVASVYRWRQEDEAFASRWRQAIACAGDLLEEEADRRGRDGADEPIFQRGKQVGTKRRYSDTLLLARLKAVRPESYRDRPATQSAAPQTVTVTVREFILEADLQRLLATGRLTLDDLDPLARKQMERVFAEAARTTPAYDDGHDAAQ